MRVKEAVERFWNVVHILKPFGFENRKLKLENHVDFTRLEPELAELRARRLDARGPRLPHPRLLAEPPVLPLVERFDIEPFSDFSAK